MDVQKFLRFVIQNNSEYVLSDEEKKTIKHEGVGQFIFNKLNSSKYRAAAMPPDLEQKVKDKISLSLDHKIPIHITLPLGAVKTAYLPTAPGIDWAEVFNIAYIREYLSPIAKAYKFGVVLEYVSVAVFENKMNRIPKKDVDTYDRELESLLDYYKKYLPNNFKLIYTRVEDTIPQKEALRLIDLKVEKLRKDWFKQSKDVIENKLFRARRNCVIKPTDKNIDELLLQSSLVHDAFCSECWTLGPTPWDKKYMITLGHNYTTNWAIHVRSCPGSSVNFWSGIGVLEKRSESFLPTVLSTTQYEKIKDSVKKTKIDLFGKEFPNLSSVPILEQ